MWQGGFGDVGGRCWYVFFFFFKQKTAYEIRNCDWSSDVCSSDLSCKLFDTSNKDFFQISLMMTEKFISPIFFSFCPDRKSVV